MSTDSAAARGTSSSGPSLARRLVETRELLLFCLIILIVIVMSAASPFFFSLANLRSILVGMAPAAIIVVGMAILLAAGGFDLSVGAVLALCSTVVSMLLIAKVPIVLAIVGALALGAIFGLANGLIVTQIGVNPLIATLGTMSVARGAALVLTQGFSIANLPPAFGFAGTANWLGLPFIFWCTIVLVVIFDLGLRHTRFLRQVYYIGANERAARLSGLAVNRVRTIAYMLTAVLAALAGVLLASRLMTGTPTAAEGLELQVLAAAVIGGSSLLGGEGTVLGGFLGVIFVALINDAMTMLAVSVYWQMVVIGIVLIIAVGLDMLVRAGNR